MSRERPKEVLFSDLPLELKKQFLHHLSKNDVEFQKLQDGRYLQAQVKIVESKGEKRLVMPPGKQTMKEREMNKDHRFHKDCMYSNWEQQRMSNNAKLDADLK
jgi:hypothetical protein